MKIHKFDPIIYPRKVWVLVTRSGGYLDEIFEHDCDLENFSDNATAIVFPCILKETREFGVAVVFTYKKYMDVETISHESVHVASCIFNDCGLRMGFADQQDEHFAYLVGWVAKCIDKVKKDKCL